MAGAKHFDDITTWGPYQGGSGLWGATGWTVPGDGHYIEDSDRYWGWILQKARDQYGDPGIRFNTNDTSQPRYLVFGDGTRVPADRTLVYHDPTSAKNWIQNDDGTVTPADSDFKPVAAPLIPAGYRHTPDGKYAPVDAQGNQIGPADNPGATPPSTAALPTDEQQSGRTADAVKKLEDELKKRYSDINHAEEKLVESLLTARATTADGQRQLNEIQKKIVEAVNTPELSVDTPTGEAAFLKFLRGQVAAIGAVVASGTLTADDQAKTIAALTALYALEPADQPPPPVQPGPRDPGEPSDPAAAETDPDLADPQPAVPDLVPGDLALGGAPIGPDPVSSLAPLLPAAMGGFPTGAQPGNPVDSLAGLAAPIAGLAGPLAGLTAQLAGERDEPAKPDSAAGDAKTDEPGDVSENKKGSDSAPAGPQPAPSATPQQVPPPQAPPPIAAPPSTAVQLPDGSTVTARSPAVAEAVKACLAGTPLDVAYRQAGIDLPPPGTPVTNPLDPGALTAGAIGMFKDHYVVALSADKALRDGQVMSLSSAASGPDFLGWMDPSAVAGPAPPPTATPALVPAG